MPDAQLPLRFAVLHHTGVVPDHYDLLIETSPLAPLRAFRAESWPLGPDAILESLPDHRRIYLDYEGPISAGRGEVARIAAGTCTIDLDTPAALHVHLAPPQSAPLTLRLAALRPPKWQCRTAQ